MTGQITITGYEELLDKLNKLPDNVKRAMQAAIKSSTAHMESKIKVYPPQTAANRPGRYRHVTFSNGTTAMFRMPFYVRGDGQYVPVRGGGWKRTKGSEDLKSKWTITTRDNGMTGVVGTNVSYAPYVVGGEDAPHHQAKVMGWIGWKTTDQVANMETDTVLKFINAEIQKALNK